MFKKKKDKFSLYLVDFARHLNETADYFLNGKVTDQQSLKDFSNKIKKLESEADEKVHTIIKELNQVFITPIEREDIHHLTMGLDDIVDGIEEFAAMLDTYEIYSSNTYIDGFTKHILTCTNEILISMELLADHKLQEIEPHAILIKENETRCDTLFHEAVRDLFKNETDPIKVIKYKDLYEILEEIADACQYVANLLQSIIMKNA